MDEDRAQWKGEGQHARAHGSRGVATHTHIALNWLESRTETASTARRLAATPARAAA